MASSQCMLAMELIDIQREKSDGLLAKRQICKYFPPSINCAIWYSLLHKSTADLQNWYLRFFFSP